MSAVPSIGLVYGQAFGDARACVSVRGGRASGATKRGGRWAERMCVVVTCALLGAAFVAYLYA